MPLIWLERVILFWSTSSKRLCLFQRTVKNTIPLTRPQNSKKVFIHNPKKVSYLNYRQVSRLAIWNRQPIWSSSWNPGTQTSSNSKPHPKTFPIKISGRLLKNHTLAAVKSVKAFHKSSVLDARRSSHPFFPKIPCTSILPSKYLIIYEKNQKYNDEA